MLQLRVIIILCAGMFCWLSPLVGAIKLGNESGSEAEYDPASLVVKLKCGIETTIVRNKRGIVQTGVEAFDQLNRSFEIREQSPMFERSPFADFDCRLRNVFVLSVDQKYDVQEMKRQYGGLEQVEYAELNYRVQLHYSPDDPLYSHQWYLNNVGQGFFHVEQIEGEFNDTLAIVYGTPDADIDGEEVFQSPPDNTSTVVVAIVDTGVDLDHPDIAGNIWTNTGEIPDNGMDDDHNGYVDDCVGWDFAGDIPFLIPDNDPTDVMGHGTHCAGIVAAISNNSIGVTGVVPNCLIMPLCFYPAVAVPPICEAIVYAADNGADVVSMSFGIPSPMVVLEDVLDYAAERGLVLVASAGNTGLEEANYPAGYETTIAVAATDCDDHVTEWSTYGNHITVCAPGLSILSLRADATDMYAQRNEPDVHIIDGLYYIASGTSMAGPVVAGVAAYLRSASHGITREVVRDILEITADDYIDPYGDGSSLPGWDKYSGYGRVNLDAALAAAPQLRVEITSPSRHQEVSGDIGIYGSADGAEFTEYVLEYGEGHFPESWTEITSSSSAVTDGMLGTWSSGNTTGVYTIRIRSGENHEDLVTAFLVNQSIAEITAPAAGDTICNFVVVRGTAMCPDFSKIVVEYGDGESPTEWELISESSASSMDGEICTWMVGMLPDGVYTLRVSVHDSSGPQASSTVQVYVRSLFAGANGWTYVPDTVISGCPNYGDFDNDGVNEIIIGAEDGIVFINPDGSQKTTGVPTVPSYDFTTWIAVGELDGDGVDDFVAIAANPDRLCGFPSSDPPFEVDLPVKAGELSIGERERGSGFNLFLMDITGDGRDEIHCTEPYLWDAVNTYIYNPDGSPFAFHTVLSKNTYLPADIDGDSVFEIYACDGDTIHQYDLTGALINEYVFETGDGWLRPEQLSAVDIDSDGKHELILKGAFQYSLFDLGNVTIWAFDENFTLVPGWPHDTGLNYATSGIDHPVFVDLDADGLLEYVAFGGYIFAWRIDGTPFVGDGILATSPNSVALQGMRVVDVDGNGYPDVMSVEAPIFGKTFDMQTLVAWNKSGIVLDNWPVYFGFDIDLGSTVQKTYPVIGDLDDDGLVDLFVRNEDGKLVFTEFTDYVYRPSAYPYPYHRYNRSMDNTAVIRVVDECGNADGYGGVDIDDVVYMIGYIFLGAPPPVSQTAGDPNCSGGCDIDDAVYLIAYIFSGGHSPCDIDGDEVPDC